ncbi:HalOD1 output domain-containing protein [Halobellus salinus]|nr:HalOD1 output domain-containing protein [Halobellus salinus]
MSEAINSGTGAVGSWAVLDDDGWETGDGLLTRLTDALAGLGPEDGTVLYDHVAVDAVLNALEPDSPARGVSEVRFDYDRYEVKITRDGVIAASPDPGAPLHSSN